MRLKTLMPILMASSLLFSAASAFAMTADEAAVLYQKGEAASREGDMATALKDLTPAAEAGNADAQGRLGEMYQTGRGVDTDYEKALYWLQKAADQGNARAYLNLGLIYKNGLGVEKNDEKAKASFEAAAKGGDFKAPRYLGLYAQAAGDDEKAASWFKDAAEKGDITSQYYLGQAYEQGRGVKQDYTLAMQWYEKSASRGDHVASDGMVGMAGLYEKGLGVDKDLDKAIALYKQAAAVDNEAAKEALKRLGVDTE